MKKIKKMKFMQLLTILFITFTITPSSFASWQTILEGHFDIVETFDDLKSWKGTRSNGGDIPITSYPNEFPVKSADSSPSIWQYYSMWQPIGSENWIDDFGAENVWRGTGKAARIDYSAGGDGIAQGPSRLGFKIGDSPDDGYSEVYLFYMTKWYKKFFRTTDNSFDYFSFLKTLDISAGFKDVWHFGTDSEYSWLSINGATTQVLNQYGLNAQVYNFQSGASTGLKLVDKCTMLTTNSTTNKQYSQSEWNFNNAEIGSTVFVDEWFGIEYRLKLSNPAGASNGEIEVWVYDRNGNTIGHDLRTGLVNYKNGNTAFNHKINKFVWGGNRSDGPYCTTGVNCNFGTTDHNYIDDIIVDGSRIGPTYFEILNPPSKPSGVNINFK